MMEQTTPKKEVTMIVLEKPVVSEVAVSNAFKPAPLLVFPYRRSA